MYGSAVIRYDTDNIALETGEEVWSCLTKRAEMLRVTTQLRIDTAFWLPK